MQKRLDEWLVEIGSRVSHLLPLAVRANPGSHFGAGTLMTFGQKQPRHRVHGGGRHGSMATSLSLSPLRPTVAAQQNSVRKEKLKKWWFLLLEGSIRRSRSFFPGKEGRTVSGRRRKCCPCKAWKNSFQITLTCLCKRKQFLHHQQNADLDKPLA